MILNNRKKKYKKFKMKNILMNRMIYKFVKKMKQKQKMVKKLNFNYK